MQLAVEQVRQGLRPAQPGGQTAVIATEPSPTESTQMLADVAEARTTRPAGAYPPSAARAVASRRPPAPPAPASSRAGGYRETAPAPQEKKPSKAGPIVAGLLALLLVGGIAAWAATSGVLDGVLGGSKTSTPTQPSVVTQTETVESTPSEEEEEPETVTRSRETVTREVEEPETLTFSEENTPEPEQSTHQSTSAAHSPTRASTSAASEPTTEQSQPAAPSETGGAGNGAGEIELPDVEEILGGNAQ